MTAKLCARKTVLIVLVLACLTPTLISPAQAVSAPTAADGRSIAAIQLQRSIEFRLSLGLRTDERYVSALENSSASTINRDLGVALTSSEFAEIDFRQEVISHDAPIVRKTLARLGLSSSFAGMFMDNQTGELTIGMTDNQTRVLSALRAAVGHPDRLRVVTAETSYEALSAIQAAIDRLRDTTDPRITATAIDEISNQVRVDVVRDRDKVQTLMDKKFGLGIVRVELARPTTIGTTAVNSPPFKGGQIIDNTTLYTCTSGFVAKTSTQYYLVTAGHCGPNGSIYDQRGLLVGKSDRTDTVGTDMTRIPIAAQFRSNLVTIWYSTYLGQGSYRSITSSQGRGADVVGETECYSGINTTSLQCGTLRTKTYSVNLTTPYGTTLQYSTGREADFDCNPGDSGGSALYGNQARGLISVKLVRQWGNDTCVYVHIWDVLSQGGLTGVVTGSS